ncbi:merozoite surface protein, putative (macronuclear) [Tetrahymena thermophila SB210]|uniref:Merozoite surface protein, putative n=1 Tax=Tetrahymena thermophila (strain SB210) TaxID=312017 RepID=I7LY18_TETTS|nr:merozoite surface protein, putative [Tetrahymena thermophila SB210]EAS07192.2 merozoite surface protein, putative [Tetrahymena thermophila SB210]|eukprot:XP_001027434.2 merozoite surface protein, putative [Tetrahymena thermophila SB210]
MGCCQSQSQFSDKDQLVNNQDQKTKEKTDIQLQQQQQTRRSTNEIQQNIKEIQNADKTSKDQSTSKQVAEQSVSKTHNQSNLPNSQNGGMVTNSLARENEKSPSNNNETQPDAGKQEDKINTQMSQDIHDENQIDGSEDDEDEDEQVVNIIDQIINQRRENMES